MPLFGPPPPRPPFSLGARPLQLALGVLLGWKLRGRAGRDRSSKPATDHSDTTSS